jgi:hypothetical protein
MDFIENSGEEARTFLFKKHALARTLSDMQNVMYLLYQHNGQQGVFSSIKWTFADDTHFNVNVWYDINDTANPHSVLYTYKKRNLIYKSKQYQMNTLGLILNVEKITRTHQKHVENFLIQCETICDVNPGEWTCEIKNPSD